MVQPRENHERGLPLATLRLISRGMLRGEALARYVNAQVGNKLIEQMPLSLGVVATDLNSGTGVLFQRGDTGMAVRASSAVPALFLPVKIGGKEYVDGGLVSPVPVRYARQMGAEEGVTLARYLRTHPDSPLPYVPIIMLTGHADRQRVMAARDAGVNEFCVKPVTPADLLKRIMAVIDHPRQFIRSGTYFGPDRRRVDDPRYKGPERRADRKASTRATTGAR